MNKCFFHFKIIKKIKAKRLKIDQGDKNKDGKNYKKFVNNIIIYVYIFLDYLKI